MVLTISDVAYSFHDLLLSNKYSSFDDFVIVFNELRTNFFYFRPHYGITTQPYHIHYTPR